MAFLHSHDVQVHEVTMHLPVPRWRVPATHCQDLQALHRLLGISKVIKVFTFSFYGKCIFSSYDSCSCSPSSPCSAAAGAPGGALCCQAGCALVGCSQSAPARCPSSFSCHYLQQHSKEQGDTLHHQFIKMQKDEQDSSCSSATSGKDEY